MAGTIVNCRRASEVSCHAAARIVIPMQLITTRHAVRRIILLLMRCLLAFARSISSPSPLSLCFILLHHSDPIYQILQSHTDSLIHRIALSLYNGPLDIDGLSFFKIQNGKV